MDQFLRDSYKFRQIVDKELNAMGERFKVFLEDNFKDHRKLESFIHLVDTLDRSKFTNPEELAFWDEYQKVKVMMEEFTQFKDNFDKEYIAQMKALTMPVFVERHEKLRAKWIERWKEIIEPSFDISESILVPRATTTETTLIDSKLTPDKLEQLNETKNLIFDSRGVAVQLPDHDVDKKDEENVLKAEIMGEILNKIADEIEQGTLLEGISPELIRESKAKAELESSQHTHIPGKIHGSELARALYVNNLNPELYNMDFFTEYFQMERKQLKNIFDFYSYPLRDHKDQKVVKILRFINLD